MAAEFSYREEAGVAWFTVDRPGEQNMLSPDVLAALLERARKLKQSREVNVLVVSGAGTEWFSTGILNPKLRASLGKEKVLEAVFFANEVFDAVEALPQIVVAGINGSLRAGAVELALACDIRLAASHARLSLPEAKWGGFPGAGAPVRLPSAVGRGRALELICTGREIDAAEMERIGLVERVVPSERFAVGLEALAGEIAAAGPLALRGAKRIVRVREEPGFRAARELSDALRHALEWSADVDEGIAAHREGRAPRFTGR
jgi:enoyl-CoA hydratase/carnithine racemase